MGLDKFIEERAVKKSLKKVKKGKDDFRLPYGALLAHESLREVHDTLTHELGEEGIKWFLYTIRAYAHEDSPLRVHISHRGDTLTAANGQSHPEHGAPLKQKIDSPNYVHKIINPNIIADQYDPSEPTHRRDDELQDE